jgi:23S rRNA pseudouridine955/2504/2580 synthase
MRTLELGDHEAGQRLDRFLRKLLPAVPLGAIFRHLRNGAIRVDGKKGKPDLRLCAGMRLELRLPEADLAAARQAPAASPKAKPTPKPRIRADAPPPPREVFRDDDVLVVDKPAGLAAQPGSGQDFDLVQWLDRQPFGVRTATFRPAPAHRLDRGTSGLVAIGLSPAGLRGLTAAFREDRVQKVYLAVVHGVPQEPEGTVDAPLLERAYASSHEPKVVVDPRGKPARTDYQVLQTKRSRSLLRLVLHTGRMHQIRAHLGHLGHPIVGDRRYGSDTSRPDGTFLLHAMALSLPHPCGADRLELEVPPPPSFARELATR